MSAQKDNPSRKITISTVSVLMVLIVLWILYLQLWGSIYDTYRYLRGIWGISHSYWVFSDTDGNPWHILFEAKPTDGYSGAHLFIPEGGSQVLTGSFWIQTIGWTSLQDVGFLLTDTGAAIWTLSGYAWSSKAGWVDFADVTYHLSNTSFSGYAWNSGIGWIDMAGSSLDLTSSGAIGKVKIIGNIGWDSIYNKTYLPDTSIKSAKIATAIDGIRKNIAILTRDTK